MKICIISYEFEPFPGGGIATYHNAAARILAEAGHEVHVVTNRAWHGSSEPRHTQRIFREGGLTIHRLYYFNESREAPADAQFLDVVPGRYDDRGRLWANDPSNFAAIQAAQYVAQLHRETKLDVIECPEFFAEAFYVLRARAAGRRDEFPPVCVHGHISSRIAFATNQHAWELGYVPHREMMLREEYCVQHADALLTPSRALMGKYEAQFGDALPALRRVIPYFLEVPESNDEVPEALRAIDRYLVCVGRIEPRKGSDLAMRAFAELAAEHDDLHLVFLGKEMWHEGESVDDVLAACVPDALRGRVLRLGNVPRAQALAAVQKATAFLHPAPWDNYPCATLEALGVGAVCIVSDQGGQSEMVENEASGLVFPADDVPAFAAAIRRVLDAPQEAAGFRAAAKTRAAYLTDESRLLAEKIELFEEMQSANPGTEAARLADFLTPQLNVRELPGRGRVVLDAIAASDEALAVSTQSLLDELGTSAAWDVVVLDVANSPRQIPAAWQRASTSQGGPWHGLDSEDVVVWLRAGVRFDRGKLRSLVCQVSDARIPCGSFAWLRPASAQIFPYAPDFAWQSLLVGGHPIPPVFAVRAGDLAPCKNFAGLLTAEQRLAALQAAACAGSKMMMRHCGEVAGDWYEDLPIVDEQTQLRAIGYLEMLGLMDATITMPGNLVEVPCAPVAPTQALGNDSGSTESNGQDPASVPRDVLQQVYLEHMALKQMGVTRLLRRMGVFDMVRRVVPKTRRLIGPGRKGGGADS